MAKFEVIKDLSGGLYFLDGKRQTIDAAQQFDVFEPRIGKVVAKCPIADRQFVDKICEKAHKAQPEWGKVTPLERAKILHKVAVVIRENVEKLAEWETRTNGKNIKVNIWAYIYPVILLGST
jgi:acyl-CoA reductase-like NAD-dependent aldehyde dehydrogenase